MAHADIIIDKDPCFEINTATRQITNMTAEKTSLIQYDHNSERFGFTMPRFVEGHDMSICDRIEVHYINSDGMTQEQIEGVYEVTDVAISNDDEEKIVFSWIISQNATSYVGALAFLIRFVCVEEDATVSYAWNTAIFTGVKIEKGMYNSDEIVAEYADVLEQWRIELFENSVYAKKDESFVAWQPKTEYKFGARVWYESSSGLEFLMCMQDHTSGDKLEYDKFIYLQVAEANKAYADIMGELIHEKYATKAEINNNGGGAVTLAEGTLTEDGVVTISTALTDDIREYKRMQFWADVTLPTLDTSATCVIRLTIANENGGAYSWYLASTSQSHKDESTYHIMGTAELIRQIDDGLIICQTNYGANKNTSLNGNANTIGMFSNLGTKHMDTHPPYFKITVTNNTFKAGTKFVVKGWK